MAASVPLIVLALAVPILKERVGHRRWFAVVLGFLGVLIILRPGFGNWQPILFLCRFWEPLVLQYISF